MMAVMCYLQVQIPGASVDLCDRPRRGVRHTPESPPRRAAPLQHLSRSVEVGPCETVSDARYRPAAHALIKCSWGNHGRNKRHEVNGRHQMHLSGSLDTWRLAPMMTWTMP